MRAFAVVDIKGGVGKTTTAVQLAAGWARAGRRVLLVDTCARLLDFLATQLTPLLR